jgi:LAGLIDADG endonuclease
MAKAKPIIPPFPADIDRDRFGDWLSGFVDGEGSFLMVWDKRRDNGSAVFRIALRHDDQTVLELIRSFLGCGWITYGNPNVSTPNARPSTLFCTAKIRDLVTVVVPHFEKHPLYAKKSRDFTIWRSGVEMLTRIGRRCPNRGRGSGRGFRKSWTEQDSTEFKALVIALKEQREYNAPPVPVPAPPPNGQGLLFE